MKENAKRTRKRVKPFIGLLFLFLSTLSAQAMNFLSKGLEFMGGYAVPMVNAVYQMCEIPKEEEEQFKESVTQLNFSSAQDMIQKQIHQLEKDPLLSHDQQVKEVNKKQAFLLYQRLEIAAITIDYVRACLKSINEVKELVQKKLLMHQYKNVEGELQEIENLTKELQLNLGALLHHRYKYTRGGGIVDRATASANSKQLKRRVWGASTLPSPNYQSYTTKIQEFEKKEK